MDQYIKKILQLLLLGVVTYTLWEVSQDLRKSINNGVQHGLTKHSGWTNGNERYVYPTSRSINERSKTHINENENNKWDNRGNKLK